jgi:phosphate transport system substrate-binding protein
MLKKITTNMVWMAIAAAVGLVTSCNSNSPSSVNITGAGSSFVNPIMTRWIADYEKTHPGVHINYQSIGSGGGIQQLKSHVVDFGATDAPLSDDQLRSMQPLVQVAESAGPVCITYNLPELTQPLRLTPAALAGIYLGTIKKWHDPAITKANPGVNIPNVDIVVAHRSDGSGTTNIFTEYLAAVSPEWASKVGKGISVSWPVGLGGKGSEGVTGLVRGSEGAIGYVELTYAAQNHLPTVEMQNKAGNWIAPSADSATAAITAFKAELDKDIRTPIVDPPASAANAYPISGLTYLLIPKEGTDKNKQQVLKDFVQYMITTGQQTASSLDYSQLPSTLAEVDQKILECADIEGRAYFTLPQAISLSAVLYVTGSLEYSTLGRGYRK